MTAEEESALLDRVAAEIELLMAQAFAEYQTRVLAGEAPRDAVMAAMGTFQGQYADALAAAFSAVLSQSVGSDSVLRFDVGDVMLSTRLYADARELSVVVQGMVDSHASGFQDARRLALDLYEGYGFRQQETLTFSRRSDLLPRYLKEALLPELADDLDMAFAQLQVDDLTTQALRAAYQGVLDALDTLQDGKGKQVLERRLRVAFEEKARYLANRIAQTELHRAFAKRQAKELMLDTDVQYVQWRISATHPEPDICDFFAGVDRYGLGPGVYPKAEAPVPTAHPFCRCVLAPRLDLNRRLPVVRPDADRGYFAAMDPDEAARIAGSRSKLQQIIDGADPTTVHNDRMKEAYRVRTVSEKAAQ